MEPMRALNTCCVHGLLVSWCNSNFVVSPTATCRQNCLRPHGEHWKMHTTYRSCLKEAMQAQHAELAIGIFFSAGHAAVAVGAAEAVTAAGATPTARSNMTIKAWSMRYLADTARLQERRALLQLCSSTKHQDWCNRHDRFQLVTALLRLTIM